MRKLIIGVVAAAGVALASPALAQIYFGAGPGGVGVGVGSGYYGGGYRSYDDDYAPRYRTRGYRSYGYDRGARCRTRLIETRYGLRRVTRCW